MALVDAVQASICVQTQILAAAHSRCFGSRCRNGYYCHSWHRNGGSVYHLDHRRHHIRHEATGQDSQDMFGGGGTTVVVIETSYGPYIPNQGIAVSGKGQAYIVGAVMVQTPMGFGFRPVLQPIGVPSEQAENTGPGQQYPGNNQQVVAPSVYNQGGQPGYNQNQQY
ncbi:hypothetical protein M427DRAFT_500682 [Gonapodya prolifera JEL478]|uniref:Uncharacterized protein n=1 Tax=Gonapodya prolifera (strain JEL478) TaxID=1344416 RepID=A0A139A9D3_GONPJ|nr:hypothetical protein M427DRAFT_500682 [Gonapodya prolifera JEL478]|eukprot:KXS13410.1 hypothetical protein M427DRAFT_500682 [Gonapodya prolifera JEL478]